MVDDHLEQDSADLRDEGKHAELPAENAGIPSRECLSRGPRGKLGIYKAQVVPVEAEEVLESASLVGRGEEEMGIRPLPVYILMSHLLHYLSSHTDPTP